MATQNKRNWLAMGIDLFTVAGSFIMAYLIRFNLTVKFDVSKMVSQLPLVVLMALLAFLITKPHKDVPGHKGMQLSYFLTTRGLSGMLLFLITLISQYWEIYPGFGIPLSIIIIYSLLAITGLTVVRLIQGYLSPAREAGI